MNGAIATVLLCVAMQPHLKVVNGPPRHFDDSVIKWTMQVEGDGAYDLEWQTRILRGIVERGQAQVTAPDSLKIELKVPAVRLRMDLFHEIQLKRDDKVLAGERVVTAVLVRRNAKFVA